MAQCRVLIGKEMDPVTGEISKRVYIDPYVENMYNTCHYFKKRFFAKKNEKRYCINCKNMYEPRVPINYGRGASWD